MGFVKVRFKPLEGGLQESKLVAKLVETFRARITCHDWYADHRLSTLRTIEWHKKAGRPIVNPQMLLDDIDRAEREAGQRFGIAVLNGGRWIHDRGHHAERPFTDEQVLPRRQRKREGGNCFSAFTRCRRRR